jgi:undecaprenyl-diphosphatase
VIGLLFEEQAEAAGNNLYSIGAMMILVGLFMGWAERVSQQRKGLDKVSVADSVVVGCTQALAVIPGTSRSGITISTALLRHIDRYAAARFSFLLSTPIIGGAAAKNFLDLYEQGVADDMVAAFVVGILVSAITGAITIRFFLDFLRRRGLTFFIAYRVIFGIIVIALAIFRS